MRSDIRLLVLGDEQVGKTSLITSLITESFSDQVPHILPEITIPPSVSPDNVSTVIVDSSARPEDRNELEKEIKLAQVICLIYSVEESKSFHRISSFWLPYIRSLGVNIPIVLVGNKIDLRGEDMVNEFLEDEIMPVMNDFKEVETCVECSALSMINVPEVFYFAQKSVLHPTAPLYDSKEEILKPACRNALLRIFKLCDVNNDGYLDDEELNQFQIKCFGIPLQQLELDGIKELIREDSDQIYGVTSEGKITEDGFLHLHQLFIQRGRLETTWAVLRKFGYDDDLSLKDEFLHPPIPAVDKDVSIELSPLGYQFFAELFSKHDKDNDGALSNLELENLFATAPRNPWVNSGFPETTITNDDNDVTLQGFLAQWSMMTLLDYKTTLEYLSFLGFPGDTRNALSIIRRKDRKKRNVFLALVVGAAGSGKSSLLRTFTGKQFKDTHKPTSAINYAVNSVDMGGNESYLVIMEITPHDALDQEILSNTEQVAKFDCVCFTFDSSDPFSFTYVANLKETFPELAKLPSIFIATKSDLDKVSQRHPQQPDEYCKDLLLPTPISISAKDGILANLFETILKASRNPHTALPTKFSEKYRKELITSAAISGISLGILTAAVLYYRLSKK